MKVAVVGSGISGLAATWLLNEHSDHEVHLFEAEDHPGGHANTVHCRIGGADVCVDTGFVSHHLKFWMQQKHPFYIIGIDDITVLPTQMTFSVSRDHGAFEWGGCCPAGVFCQFSRLLDPGMWRLLYDIMRFNACARELVVGANSYLEDYSVAEYLAREGYSNTFRDDYLIPIIATIWSTPPDRILRDFPARTLVKFLANHHLLQTTGKPTWLTIEGGSYQYVRAIIERLPESQLHLSTPIVSVGTVPDGTVQIMTADGRLLGFDRVIMACHSDTTLALLKAGSGATEEEDKILSRFAWNRNEVVVHNDVNFMPKSRLIWSSWNYLTFSVVERDGTYKADVNKVSLTYNMNLLQRLPTSKYGPVLITLNPPAEPASGITARFQYDHPVLNTEALASMREMGKIQGRRGILYAGAWLGYGFHEDGFTSGLRAVAHHIDGVRIPFEIASVNRPVQPVLAARVFNWFEWSGARHVLGKILSFILRLLGKLILVDNVRHAKRVKAANVIYDYTS